MKSHLKILTFRKTHTLQKTGDKFGITAERVRQIEMLKHRKRCEIHQRYYYNTCSHCFSRSYVKLIDFSELTFILNECKKEAKNRKRDWLSVRRRIALIRVLYRKFHKSFNEIAVLLDRDFTTVSYLYKQHAK